MKTITKNLVIYFILFTLLQGQEIPLYNKVIHGKLKNGITYYILPNKEPKNRVELFLAVNAGSILEDDDQLGLAHFVEHMAFNGSKHFKKNELIEFLQSVGVSFGPDLNAYTSFDETVYMIHLPTNDKKAINKGFLVLEDWAHNLTFDPDEVNKERNVVLEEWRLGQGPMERIRRKIYPKIFQNSRYAERLPIGKPEIIKNAPRETLIRFYKDWYRPDLMAVIIVGDIDTNLAKKKIIKHFSKIKPANNPRERKFFPVPDNKETIVAIATDKEAPFNYITISIKQPKRTIKTENDYKKIFIDKIISIIMEERYAPYLEKAENSLINAGISYSSLTRTKDELSIFIMPTNYNIKKAFEIGFGEAVRAYQNGFTQEELNRAKKELLREYEEKLKEKDKTNSRTLVWKLVSHFLRNYPFPGPEYDYNFLNKILNSISLEDINNQYKSYWKKQNRIITLVANDKQIKNIPSEKQLIQWMNEVENKSFNPYSQNEITTTLMEENLKPKLSITSKEKLENLQITKITFSNGLTIYLKPTDFKEDEIIIYGYSEGGRSLLTEKYDDECATYSSIITQIGVKNLAKHQLDKLLKGKKADLSMHISDHSEGFRIETSPKDLETAIQLLYLYIKSPRFEETNVKAELEKNKFFLQSFQQMPMLYFYSFFNDHYYGNNPRNINPMHPKHYQNANPKEIKELHFNRFNNIADFTISIAGKFNENQLIEIINKYLGNLPAHNNKENYNKNFNILPVQGNVKHTIYKGQAEKANTRIIYHKKYPLPLENRLKFKIFTKILSMRLIKKVREENSLVYSIRCYASTTKIPEDYLEIIIEFPSAPKNIDTIITIIQNEINDLLQNGATDDEIKKAKKQILTDYEEAERKNNSWAYAVIKYLKYNEPIDNFIKRKEILQQLTWNDIKNDIKKFFENPNYYELRLLPEKYK